MKRKMRVTDHILNALIVPLVFLATDPVAAQESIHRVIDLVDLPSELNPDRHHGCTLEFQEHWYLNPATSSVSKKVDAYKISCEDSSALIPPAEGEMRIKNITYEFSFLDLQEEAVPMIREEKVLNLQKDFIDFMNALRPLPDFYDPPEQLLSVYFHEEWIIDADRQEFNKWVKGITPVIWQKRQTADGEPVHDADTGYPVFYKLKLERIDLRQP